MRSPLPKQLRIPESPACRQPTFTTLTAAQTLAQNMATAAVTGLINAPSINLVAGQPAGMTTLAPTIDWTRQGNPHVTVNLQRTNLPTFFSKVWASGAPSVTATATAEVYNPSNLPTMTPISPKSVKPWLVANADPLIPARNSRLSTLGPVLVETECDRGNL